MSRLIHTGLGSLSLIELRDAITHERDRGVGQGAAPVNGEEECPGGQRSGPMAGTRQRESVCVYYFRTYYKAVRGGGGGEWRTCAIRDDEPRPVWMSLLITH